MIDLSFIKADGKTYSVKTLLKRKTEDSYFMKIMYIFEVQGERQNSSYIKKKTVYENDGEEQFNPNINRRLYKEILENISKKYKIKTIFME